MRALANEISDLMTSLGQGIAFPGRLRVYCDDHLAGLLPRPWAVNRECPQATGSAQLAAGVGAAWAERGRAGQVLVIVRRSALDQGLWWEAADLAGRLHLDNLSVLLVGGSSGDCARMLGCAWRDDHLPPSHARSGPRVRLAVDVAAGGPAVPPLVDRCVGDWPPVHLESMPQGALPPWPLGEGQVGSAVDRWLGWLAQREPRLLLPHELPAWTVIPDTPAKLLALAQLAGDGWRVCWRLRTPGSLLGWLDALDAVGRRGLPLKLILERRDLPTLAHVQALPGWWVLAPADLGETSAVLAHALDNEHATVITLTDASPVIPAWPSDQAYMPGTGRTLIHGTSLTLVCDSSTAQAACAARTVLQGRGVEAEVFHCTTLLPLPCAELAVCAQRAPLMVCTTGAPALTDAINAILCAMDAPHHAVSCHASDRVPDQSQMVARALALIAPGCASESPSA